MIKVCKYQIYMYLYSVIKTNDQMKRELLKSENLENLGHKIAVSYYDNGSVVAMCMRDGQKSFKPVFNYRFSNEARMLEHIVSFFKSIQSRVDEKKRNSDIKAEARKNFVNPYKVGQVLYASWGYEQTNIDFYQVISVKGKTVEIREISGSLVDGSTKGYHDAGKVKPNVDNFISESMKKIVQISCYNEQVNYRIRGKYDKSLYNYDCGNDGVYCSWGY